MYLQFFLAYTSIYNYSNPQISLAPDSCLTPLFRLFTLVQTYFIRIYTQVFFFYGQEYIFEWDGEWGNYLFHNMFKLLVRKVIFQMSSRDHLEHDSYD